MLELDYSSNIICGIELRKAGDYSSAMELFADLIAAKPHDVTAYIEAGKTQSAARCFEPAMHWFEQAQVIAPSNFWPFFLRAQILQVLSRYKQALEVIETGLTRCRGKVSDLEYANLIKLFIDVKALCIEMNGAGMPPFTTNLPKTGRPYRGALHVTVVKDAEDIIFASLEASYIAGIRYFAIADNESSDATRFEIERFKIAHTDCIVLLVIDPIVGHFQAAKTMGLAYLAGTILKGIGVELDWIFPLDADELLFIDPAAGDLAGLLASEKAITKKLLVYHHYNAFSAKIYDSVPVGADVVTLFPNYAGLARVPVRKVAFRNLSPAYIEEGNHFCSNVVALPDDVMSGAELGISLRHFPVRSISQLRSKIINGGRSIAELTNPGIGAHWRIDCENYNKLGESYILQRIQDYNVAGRV